MVRAKNGFVEKNVLKATTVHQELRVLSRMLNVAVRKKFLFANPCAGVEFPARVDGLFRPHYMTWSEQQTIELNGPRLLSCLTKFSRLGSDLFQVKFPRSTARNLRIRRRTA